MHRIYEIYSDRRTGKVSMVLELLDLDLYRLMRSHPLLMPSNPKLVKVGTHSHAIIIVCISLIDGIKARSDKL